MATASPTSTSNPALPSPPFINIPEINNFRDLGDGKAVRRGLVFRSADPSNVTPEGLRKMSEELGISTIFDLRSTPEIQRAGPEWADVEASNTSIFAPFNMTRRWTPIFADADYGPEQIAVRYRAYTQAGSEGFVQAYREFLEIGAKGAFGEVLRYLAGAEAPRPCLIHCTAGKDRTGVLCALLLRLGGADADAVAAEYALTDLGLAPVHAMFISRLMRHPALGGNEDGARNMVSAKQENMAATLAMLEREYGGAERYVREKVGLSEDEVSRLKGHLRGVEVVG